MRGVSGLRFKTGIWKGMARKECFVERCFCKYERRGNNNKRLLAKGNMG